MAVHVALAAILLAGSGQQFEEWAPQGITPVFYLPPPDRAPSDLPAGEQLTFVTLPGDGSGGASGLGSGTDAEPTESLAPGEESTGQLPGAPAPDDTPVFTVIEVDREAVRLASSAAPAYPERLLQDGIEGEVIVQYVVDASGFADSSSLRVLSASRPEFADAVRAALPRMRFTPARIGSTAVRQLVEQPFVFRVQRPAQSGADTVGTRRISPQG